MMGKVLGLLSAAAALRRCPGRAPGLARAGARSHTRSPRDTKAACLNV